MSELLVGVLPLSWVYRTGGASHRTGCRPDYVQSRASSAARRSGTRCRIIHARHIDYCKRESHFCGWGTPKRLLGWVRNPTSELRESLSASDRLSYHFFQMIEAASLRVLSFQRVEIPFGNYCDFYTGIDGTSLSKYKAVSIENYVQIGRAHV